MANEPLAAGACPQHNEIFIRLLGDAAHGIIDSERARQGLVLIDCAQCNEALCGITKFHSQLLHLAAYERGSSRPHMTASLSEDRPPAS